MYAVKPSFRRRLSAAGAVVRQKSPGEIAKMTYRRRRAHLRDAQITAYQKQQAFLAKAAKIDSCEKRDRARLQRSGAGGMLLLHNRGVARMASGRRYRAASRACIKLARLKSSTG